MSAEAPFLSVVIPTLNERPALERALECTRVPGVERIVADGGSVDGTCELAQRLGAEKVLRVGPGRARQLDAGARAASAEAVLFLHADTRLERGWEVAVRGALADPAVSGGAFELRFDSERAAYRLLELGARLRARLGGLPYGDQALFVRRRILEEGGWIVPTPIFEDLDLARLLRSSGRLALLRTRAWTSPRRYEARGVLRTWLRNSVALAAYLSGLDRERVARWYHGKGAR